MIRWWFRRRVLCRLGIHSWFYFEEFTMRGCEHCPKQEYLANPEEPISHHGDEIWKRYEQ